VGAVIAFKTEFDDSKRSAIASALTRTMTGISQTGDETGFRLPPSIARSMLPDTSVVRTGVGYQASGAGGFGATLKMDMAPDVFDRQRTTLGPVDLINWWPVETREYLFPAVQETSRATGSRWGGIQATWGLGETVLPTSTDGKVSQANFVNSRLLIYTTVSRDVWSDARKLERWLSYIALSEIRFSIELAIVQGVLGGPGGIINSAGTVTVAKGSTGSSSIGSANVDAMWSALSPGSKRNAVWMCNDDTYQKIDQLALSGQWPEIPYIPAGTYGNAYATIKGRPLLPCEACPLIGQPGDLIVWDPTDYIFTYLQPKPESSPLSFSVEIPQDSGHTGIRGLPEGIVEQRVSEEFFFNTDTLALVWKFRGDGRFLWNSTATNINGATVGCAAVTAVR